MKNLLPPVVGTLVVLLIALAAYLIRQNRAMVHFHARAAEEQTAFARRVESLQWTIHERERELREANDRAAQLKRELTVARAAAGLEPDRNHAADPAALEFRRKQQRRMVQERYGDLFDRLGLSPESLEEFKRLLMELEDPTSPGSSVDSTTTGGGTTADGNANAPAHRSTSEIHEAIYYLLGYEDYSAFDRYGRELTNVRPVVRRFANDAADAGIPLTAVQSAALSRVIFEVTDAQTNADAVKAGANVPDPESGLTPLDEIVLERAADVLSKPQLELLKAFRVHEREGLEVWRNSLPPAEPPTAQTPPPPAPAPAADAPPP